MLITNVTPINIINNKIYKTLNVLLLLVGWWTPSSTLSLNLSGFASSYISSLFLYQSPPYLLLFGHSSYFNFLKCAMLHSATGPLCRLHTHLVDSKFSPTRIPTSCSNLVSTNSSMFKSCVTSSAFHQTHPLGRGSLWQAFIELDSSPSCPICFIIVANC